MDLLLKSDIDLRVTENIKGRVARIGGSVDHLIDYDRCKVTDINIEDGGFGDVKNFQNIKTARSLFKTLRMYIKQELKHACYGEGISRDRKTIILDMHDAMKSGRLKEKFEAAISSNVIEHSPNPIHLLLNFYFITGGNGYQFHAIPHYKYTYDVHRSPTPLEHLISDFETRTGMDDESHREDYIESAIVKHGWMKNFHLKYPVAYPFMHFHVFDEYNTRKLVEYMFEDVTVDIYRSEKHCDNVVFFRNRLNRRFVERYLGKQLAAACIHD